MSLLLLPLIIALGICFVPIWLLPRRNLQRPREYFIASQPTPPDVLRNCFLAYPLRIASFGPFFAWGASGDFWPAIISAACFGSGVYLIYLLRRPLLAFLDNALGANTSMTLPAFAAKCHGNDGRVRLLTASLTVVALIGLITAEAVATATLMKPVMMAGAGSVFLVAAGMLILTVLYTIFAGNSGVMHTIQLQVGMIYLGLFGSTALLLYFLVSDVSAMPPHGSFAVLFTAAACVFILYSRRFKYVDNTPIGRTNGPESDGADDGRKSFLSRLLRRLEKLLDIFISVFVILAIVLVAMEIFAVGFPVLARDSIVVLQAGTRLSGMALLTIAVVPLLYPIVDAATWQRLAVLAQDTGTEPDLRSAIIRRIFKSLAAEVILLLLLMCMLGAIAIVATQAPVDGGALQIFIGQLALEESLPATLALSLLTLGMVAMPLTAMSSMLSASLWTLRCDILPALWPVPAPKQTKGEDEAIARRRAIVVAFGLCLAGILLVGIADSLLGMGLTSSTFFAVLVACWCAQFSFAPLVLAPMVLRNRGRGEVSAPWALVIIAVAAGSGITAVIIYVATGVEAWLWGAVPACLGSGLVLLACARLRIGYAAGGQG